LGDFGLPVEERESLFTSNPPPGPARPKGAWWATGLRSAVRDHPGIRSLGRLAAKLDVPAQELFEQAELLEPILQDPRDRISKILGPTTISGAPLFTTQVPDWSKFRWAPKLRKVLERTEVQAAQLAHRMDVELSRVHDWMEMDEADVGTRWAKGKARRGQISPATLDALVDAINTIKEELKQPATVSELVAETRDSTGALYARKPTLRIAIEAQQDGLRGFCERIDAEPTRVERWADQLELVLPDTQDRILRELGLANVERHQLFRAQLGIDEALG